MMDGEPIPPGLSGEIAIFRKVGMTPVFFGQTVAGRNLPNLTYMIGYDDLAARERAWKAFGGDRLFSSRRDRCGDHLRADTTA